MDRNGGPSTREWPLLQEVPDSVFRACYSKMRTEDHYQAFKKQLLVGDVKRYRQLELKMVVRELSRVYKDRLAFSLQACKADLARQIEFLRGEGEDSCRELIRVNIKQSSSILDSPPASQVSEGENFLRRQQARTSDWDIGRISERLITSSQLNGHQQPHLPTLRWLGGDAIAALRASSSSLRIRQQLRVVLTTNEHRMVTNARKQSARLHLACLSRDLEPAQWPDHLTITVDGKEAEVPHASWRPKDETKSWHRVVSPVDLTGFVSPLTCTLNVSLEATKVESTVILAVCVVENKGVTAVFEEARARILEDVHCPNGDTRPLALRMSQEDVGEQVVLSKTDVTLCDPVTLRRVTFPVRSRTCAHINALDLRTYIDFCTTSRVWSCPECQEPAPLSSLIFDSFINGVLRSPTIENDTSIQSIIVESDGTWKPKIDASEPASAPRRSARTKKRPHSEVVFLEEEEDEDDDDEDSLPGITPLRPAKHQRLERGSRSVSDLSSSLQQGTPDCPIEL